MDTKQIKVIRALWGDYKKFKHEIPLSPLFDEVVYVWGEANNNFLTSLGYKTVLVDRNDFAITNEFKRYLPKLYAFDYGCRDFQKILFLDWDTIPKRELTQEFYNDLDSKEFSAPLYCYPKGLEVIPSAVSDEYASAWISKQIPYLEKYAWKMDNLSIIPNAGFVYISNQNIASSLLYAAFHFNLETLIEEFALTIYADCTLEDYILKYEPSTIRGRSNNDFFNLGPIEGYYSKQLNDYIEKSITKDIYFEHI